MPTKRPSVNQQLEACRKWNERYPIGTPVTVELDSGEIKATKTSSKAGMLGAWAAIMVEGTTGSLLLSRVRAKGETHHAA